MDWKWCSTDSVTMEGCSTPRRSEGGAGMACGFVCIGIGGLEGCRSASIHSFRTRVAVAGWWGFIYIDSGRSATHLHILALLLHLVQRRGPLDLATHLFVARQRDPMLLQRGAGPLQLLHLPPVCAHIHTRG